EGGDLDAAVPEIAEDDETPAAEEIADEDDDDLAPPKKGGKATDRKEVKDLLALGRDKGFLTYDEVNDALPSDIVSSDQIDAVLHSAIAIKEIIQIGERLKKGKMRVREVIRDAPDEDDETFDEQGRTDQVVKLIDKIRRLDKDNEHYGELMSSKTRKVSENKRKAYRDAIARNEASIAETLSEGKLNKRQ